MYNDLQILKARVGIYPDALELDDEVKLPDVDGKTAFEMYLEDTATLAGTHIDGWIDPGALPADALLKRAEILLVQAEIVMDYGIQESILPSEITTGGNSGEKVKFTRMNLDDRARASRDLMDRAYKLINGSFPAHSGIA